MEVRSLGLRTDLALLEYAGSQVEGHGDHLVVRTPSNPGYWWGNVLVLPGPPEAAEPWLERFEQALPGAAHRAFAVDGTDVSGADLAAFAEAGLRIELSAVMTATAVHPPPRPNRDADYRAYASDGDWEQRLALMVAGNDDQPDEAYWEFAARKAAADRSLVEQGKGQWFGAFVDGRLVTTMGLVAVDGGLARFQEVNTHPDHRGRGYAGSLVHHVARYGFDTLGATTLVMVADPDYSAIRIYRSVGFAETERTASALRPAPG